MVQNRNERNTASRGRGEREERKKSSGGDKETFKAVNSQRVAIPGVASIPPWYSPDKKCLNAADKRRRKKWKEGGQKGGC